MTRRPPPPPEGKVPPEGASKDGVLPVQPPQSPEPPVPAVPLRSRPRRPATDRARQARWVVRLQDGDEAALREVIAAYGERLTAVVAGILRDRDAVDDVVQATFTKAWYRIRSFKGDAGLYTWLYRVAVNTAKDYVKGRRRRPLAALDERAAAQIPDAASHVLEGLERRELRIRVRAAIAELPERYRTVLALRELEGMTYQEISEVLGLSLGTVESRLFRARRRLGDALVRAEARRGLRAEPGEEQEC